VREQGLVARTVVLKVRYGDFKTLTRSHTFATPQATGPSFWTAARALLDGLPLRDGVRLLGVSASGLLDSGASSGQQLQLLLVPTPAETGAGGRPTGSAGAGARPLAATSGRTAMAPGPGAGPAWAKASQAVDAVRARFGAGALRPGTSLVEPEKAKERTPPERP
jgi:DNA polymerase-4